jgi:hypothetical protein
MKPKFMEPKLEFLLPDITTANQVAESLILADVDSNDISFFAKPGTDIRQLHASSSIESASVKDDGKWVLVGAAFGLLSGLYLYHFYPWMSSFVQQNWSEVVTIAIILWAITFVIGKAIFGINLFDAGLKKYKNKVDHGAILMIVKAPFKRANEIRSIVNKSYLQF